MLGAAARGEGEPNDFDFLVEFEPVPRAERASAYGRPVDLVMAKATRNQRFLQAIEGERTPLYATCWEFN